MMEVSAFMTEQLKEKLQLQRDHDEKVRADMEAKLEVQRKETEAQRKDAEAKLEQQRREAEAKLKAEMEQLKTDLTPQPPTAAITQEQLAALQLRIEGMHAAKLLADDEMFALEDLIADYVELTMSMPDRVITREMVYSLPTTAAASKLDKLVGLSAAMVGDAAFARQARRKFL